MKSIECVFLTLLLLLVLLPGAYSISDDQYFSVEENSSYTCIYINLPQDLDTSSIDSAINSEIKSDRLKSPWIDTTSISVKVNPGMLSRQPVCFYHEGKKEGDYSFFELNLSSAELSVNKGIKGGICITKYDDIDVQHDTDNATDICELLSKRADIFDVQFRYPYIEAKPGELIRNGVYVTSYAHIRIKFNIESDIENDLESWITATDPSSPTETKSFKMKAPETEGSYNIIVRGSIMGCNMEACRKTTIGVLRVSENASRRGFVLNVVPQNINIKDVDNVTLKLLVTNYENDMNFSISATGDNGITVSPKKKSVNVKKNSFASVEFVITPNNGDENLYTINFDVLSEDNEEHAIEAHVSFGELLTDAKREVDKILEDAKENGDKETETFVLERFEEFKEKRNQADYGDDLSVYDEFKKSLKKAKKGEIKSNTSTTKKPKTRKIPPHPDDNANDGNALDWMVFLIPLIIIIGVIAFFIYKKTQNVSEKYDYPGFDEESI
ncbi:MAG: hypothetical protein GXO64_01805 [Candidatus Micrarchaeota archaeon]|nr:hypothetical protein [Candidatus Micrarchaeota archaeon]